MVAVREKTLCMRILSRKMVEQTRGSRLGTVCGSRTEAMQKTEAFWTHWQAWFIKVSLIRSAKEKRLCIPVAGDAQTLPVCIFLFHGMTGRHNAPWLATGTKQIIFTAGTHYAKVPLSLFAAQ